MKAIINQDFQTYLKVLRDQGFDQIKFPGGTSKNGEHYCCAIHYQVIEEKLCFLVVPYDSSAHKTERRNGNQKKDNEIPEITLRREMFEETGLTAIESQEMEDCRKEMPSHDGSSIHKKFYFLIHKVEGQIVEFSGKNPIDPETAAPMWMPVKLLRTYLFGGHMSAFYAAENVLKAKSSELHFLIS